MKILVVSLLRVGDFIMQEPLFRSLQSQFPEAELHILANDVTERYLLQSGRYQNIHIFRRAEIQRYLVEQERPKYQAYTKLESLVGQLNAIGFSRVYNFSPTRFSAQLMDLLIAPVKIGARFENGKSVAANNSWSQFLNENFSQNMNSPFQVIDILTRALDLPSVDEKEDGGKTNLGSESPLRIAMQVLTSDKKKNWLMVNYLQLARRLQQVIPKLEISILGAPDEESLLRQYFSAEKYLQIKILNWRELVPELEKTQLLITGDTSVQHLAAQLKTPVLSLFLGGANPQKTAPRVGGALIMQSTAPCQPCAPTGNCSQPSQICAENLSVDQVFKVVMAKLSGGSLTETSAKVFQVTKKENGFYFLKLQGKQEGADVNNLQRSLEQLTWQIYLDQGHLETAGPFGSSSYIFIDEHSKEMRETRNQSWLAARLQDFYQHEAFLDLLEGDYRRQVSPVILNRGLGARAFPNQNLRDQVTNHLFGKTNGQNYFFDLLSTLSSPESHFTQLKKVKDAIRETRALITIEIKLIKSILVELKERNFTYVSGTRTLSDVSLTAP